MKHRSLIIGALLFLATSLLVPTTISQAAGVSVGCHITNWTLTTVGHGGPPASAAFGSSGHFNTGEIISFTFPFSTSVATLKVNGIIVGHGSGPARYNYTIPKSGTYNVQMTIADSN